MFDRDSGRTCEIDDGPPNESDEVAITVSLVRISQYVYKLTACALLPPNSIKLWPQCS